MAFMDIDIGLGRTIYTDNSFQISEELIWPMISAINNFIMECTNDEKGLETAVLEDIMLYLYSPLGDDNPLRFIFFTDIYDNIYYLKKKGQAIFELLSNYLSIEYFSPPEKVMQKAIEIAEFTQEFPTAKIFEKDFQNQIQEKISLLEEQKKVIFSQLFIGDIDGGVVFTLKNRTEIAEKSADELFANLLNTFKIDQDLWASSSLSVEENKRIKDYLSSGEEFREGWYINQLGMNSDFWLVGYFYYNTENEKEIREFLDWLASKIKNKLQQFLKPSPF